MQEKTQIPTENRLATAPVGRLLVTFSIPCVLSMLVSALYNIVDQIFIGQGVGYLGNAATNVVFPYTVAALAVALLIGDGSAALFSLCMGRGERDKASRSVANGLTLTLLAACLLTAAGFVFEDGLLQLFGVTEACYDYAKEYMTVILIGIPFYVFTSSANGMIRADGSPGYAMVAAVLGAVINLILDPIAIFALDMGVTGAAAATVIGQVVTAILSACYFRRPKSFRLARADFRLDGAIVKRIGQVGISSFIIQIAIVIVTSVANHVIGRYGPQSVYGADIPLSAVGIVMKVFAIVIAFAVGIAVGGQPIVGYNYGARRYDRVMRTCKLIMAANLAVGLAATFIFELCPQAVVNLFGHENALYNEYAVRCFRVFLSGICLCCIQKAGSIFLQSLGKPVSSTLLSLSRDVVFFVPGLMILGAAGGVTGMLWAAPIADILAFALTAVLLFLQLREIRFSAADQAKTQDEGAI